jgi:hypothetical protein
MMCREELLAFRGLAGSDLRMIRGGVPTEVEHNALIALARDVSAPSRVTRRPTAWCFWMIGGTVIRRRSRQRALPSRAAGAGLAFPPDCRIKLHFTRPLARIAIRSSGYGPHASKRHA